MLTSVLDIKLTCEWHKAIKLNYKNSRTTVLFVHRFQSTLCRPQLSRYLVTSELPCCKALAKVTAWRCLAARHARWTGMASRRAYSTWIPQKSTHFDGHYLHNRSTFDIGVLGYIFFFFLLCTTTLGEFWPSQRWPSIWGDLGHVLST
jgi:hypothetical protein